MGAKKSRPDWRIQLGPRLVFKRVDDTRCIPTIHANAMHLCQG